MAYPAVTATPQRMRGGTLLGFLIGLILGLSIAVVVAIFVTRAPVPFVNKGNRASERVLEPRSQSEAPDPNAPLHSKARPGQEPTAPAAPITASPPVAVPSPGAPPPTAVPDAKTDERASYLLQAGAFRSSSDAEAMKAKLALIGFEARVLTADVNGQAIYRVRIGPYAELDTMNRARSRLAENGVEASVVRQR